MTEEEVKLRVEKWKDQHQAVYMSEVNDIYFIWRTLSRGEFKKASEYYETDEERVEYVCRMCVLDPEVYDYSQEAYAGIPEVLSKQILEQSGFGNDPSIVKDLMTKYEKEMQSFEHQISCVIVECFPKFSLEEVENWSMEKTIYYYSRAKWMLENLRGVEIKNE